MRRQDRTLVAHIDTDEYIGLNPMLRNKPIYRDYSMPTLEKPGAISSFVKNVLYQDEFLFDKANFPCLSMPRLLFRPVEDQIFSADSSSSSNTIRLLGTLLNRTTLETLRWKYHAAYNDTERNAQPKVIVDVSLVDPSDQMFGGHAARNQRPFSIHRPSKVLCRFMDQMNLQAFQRYPLIVHHYIGTLERYLARNDSRRSARLYHNKTRVQAGGGADMWITDWLAGFVRAVGEATARVLLDRHIIALD
jgi:hypothetical protein